MCLSKSLTYFYGLLPWAHLSLSKFFQLIAGTLLGVDFVAIELISAKIYLHGNRPGFEL